MARSKAKQGADFERSILNKLRLQGYDGMRSAGSHGVADLLVWEEVSIIDQLRINSRLESAELKFYMIQCKHSLTRDANFKALFAEENVIKLAAMPDTFTKVIVIKQPRSIRNIQFVYDGTSWKLRNIFDV
jgi:Holliday junction resolvase